jgi:hypothetical protein
MPLSDPKKVRGKGGYADHFSLCNLLKTLDFIGWNVLFLYNPT